MSAHHIIAFGPEHYVCVPCDAVLSSSDCTSPGEWIVKVTAFVDTHEARSQLAQTREDLVVARAVEVVAQAQVEHLEGQ